MTGLKTDIPELGRRYLAVRLDGTIAGWILNAEGGAAEKPTSSTEDMTQPGKHSSFSEIVIRTGAMLGKPLYQWIESSWSSKHERKSGAIVAADFDYKEKAVLEFFDALISEIGFPALDGASKDAAKLTVKIAPEWTRYKRGDTTVDHSDSYKLGKGNQKKWYPANFRLRIEGLQEACAKIKKVDEITIKQAVAVDQIGAMRTPQKVPGKIEYPNISFYLPPSEAAPFNKWHQTSVAKGTPARREGTLDYLSSDGSVVAHLVLHGMDCTQVGVDSTGSLSYVVLTLDSIEFDFPNGY
jgi:hypothetical protein